MSLIYDLPVIEDIIAGVVDSIRETGTIDGVVFASGVSTVTSSNSLSNGDIIVINNEDYKVFEVGTSVFKVKGDVSAFSEWKACAPYFMDGHLVEVSQRLAEKDESVESYKYKKYPLIVMLQDFSMKKHNGPLAEADLDFVIVDDTKLEYDTYERRENKFKTILDPLYSQFINALDKTLNIAILSEDWQVTRRYYWGSSLNDENIFNDTLDAIEINQIKIETTLKC